MECSQKVNCKPQASTAKTGGAQAAGMVNMEVSLVSRSRWSWVRSCGSRATERASKARTKVAQTAENKFKARGRAEEGSQRNGYITKKVSGAKKRGRQFQPADSIH